MSDRISELIDRAYEIPHGPESVALLEEAAREADVVGDVSLAYEARMELIEHSTHSGYHEKSLVAFSWCLAQFEQTPDDFDLFELLWKYKWILDSIPAFAQVTRTQIVDMQDDMARRYAQYEFNLRPVHYLRMANSMRMGELDEAMLHYEKFRKTQRDVMADCPACECDKEVELMARFHRDTDSLKLAKPIFSGKMVCAEVPQLTYGHVVRPLLRLNRMDEAAKLHATGYRLISTNPEFLSGVAEQLLYLVRAADFTSALRVFERHLPWAVATAELDGRFRFYSSATILFEHLAGQSDQQRKVILPEKLECFREDGSYETSALASWFCEQSEQLAAQFNQRNGNDYYSRQLRETRQLAAKPGVI